MAFESFHTATQAWFSRRFDAPTNVQRQAWAAIAKAENTLIAAPTGSGKTLAAFLNAIDDLVREGLNGPLSNATRVLYVSPLKALSNDIQKNLQEPLAGITDELMADGRGAPEIRAMVRTGDTPQSERGKMRKKPPHILVTTPESLYILLTSESGRAMLGTVRTVIVDEIHALAGSKRGAHLALSLERLAQLCPAPPVRLGLSATQKPIEEIARLLTGVGEPCTVIDTGHDRERDLDLCLPGSPLETIMSAETWQEVYDQLAELAESHQTTLIFVNTRRLAERAARFLAERIGEEFVAAHHGSLSKEHRLHAEQRLKAGRLKALVATASLELGIDIGDVDLVCQLGSPRSIAAFLQRVGRSGHAVRATPKGRLFPLSRDDLVECAALLRSIADGELDRIHMPAQPLDVLSQQIVAEVAAREWSEQALYDALRHAWPYRDLSRETFTAVLCMLADGITTRRGRRSAYLHRDAVNGRLRPRRAARLVATMNGGTIPDQFDYDVIMAPEDIQVGTLNEDFAFESLPGDIFQLGNTSYRILRVETGRVIVQDAHGEPPNIPFWFGEAPGRTDELSAAVSTLRKGLAQQIDEYGLESASEWLARTYALPRTGAEQAAEYLGAGHAAFGALPTLDTIILERFFDDTGDQHLVVHSTYGSRLNRAWGLSLRKRFCRRFNFELQAAADENAIVLSLGATHSFPLEEVAGYLKADSVRDVLIQALLDAPMFGTRWRWNASIALAIQRMRSSGKVPPAFQRADAEDLVAVVFPDQLACLENIAGAREIPDHPLVTQTIEDCLTDTMDIEGLRCVLQRIAAGQITILCRDLTEPSPLSQEILNARPYAFLDDAPAEERKTMAISARRHIDPRDARDLGSLDPKAIEKVRHEAWPEPRDADELHDALVTSGFVSEAEGAGNGWQGWFDLLSADRRVTRVHYANVGTLWVAAERLGEMQLLHPDARLDPPIQAVLNSGEPVNDPDTALRELLRSRLEAVGPVRVVQLATPLGVRESQVEAALASLQAEGAVMQGRFEPDSGQVQWCDRRLLARINRYTVNRLRREVRPVSAKDYLRFLVRWHGLGKDRGSGGEYLLQSIERLQGFAAPISAWEGDVLPARVEDFSPGMLDELCASGQVVWLRIGSGRGARENRRPSAAIKATPITFLLRDQLAHWPRGEADALPEGSAAHRVLDLLREHGASFYEELLEDSRLLEGHLSEALSQLVAAGLVTCDSFSGLRRLLRPAGKSRGRRRPRMSLGGAGRWSLIRRRNRGEDDTPGDDRVEAVAWTLLRRYGVVFRRVLERETGLPTWRDLLYCLRRLEARGEVRGGRFVNGFSGEQFALPEAVGLLRRARGTALDETLCIAASDPLNLFGILTPDERIPALAGHRILLEDAEPVAIQRGKDVSFLKRVEPQVQWQMRNQLLRRARPGGYLDTPARSM